MTELSLSLPYRRPPLSLNDRSHWRVSNGIKQELAKAVLIRALEADLPRRVQHATITLLWNPGDRRRRDTDNMFATLKPCIDALVRYGLIEDDDSTRVTSHCRIGDVVRDGALSLLIEVTP